MIINEKWKINELCSYGHNLKFKVPFDHKIHGVSLFTKNSIVSNIVTGEQNHMNNYHADEITPLLHSIDKLNSEIIIDNYNNNAPFIPLLTLFSLIYDTNLVVYNDKFYYKTVFGETCQVKTIGMHICFEYSCGKTILEPIPYYCSIDLLNLWQINWRQNKNFIEL